MKDVDLEVLEERLKNQEKERQSELLQLQMEVSVHLQGLGLGVGSLRPFTVKNQMKWMKLKHLSQKKMSFGPWRHLLLSVFYCSSTH